jgi:magnesium chelatase subunit H
MDKINFYTRIHTGSGDKAELLLGGRLFGNVWVGVQPPLGLPGDPMRLLFERDMTPHPQYVAFYKYLEQDASAGGFGADAIVHFGMHGTEEWLPGTPLGNTGECWPDILTGALPNIYVYAANNPSESLLAKRRGYGTLISHNVPPYSRAGLYKDLLSLRSLLADYEETANMDATRASQAQNSESMVAMASGFGAKQAGSSGGNIPTVDMSALDAQSSSGVAAPSIEGALLQTLFSAGLDKDVPLPESALKVLQEAGQLPDGCATRVMSCHVGSKCACGVLCDEA